MYCNCQMSQILPSFCIYFLYLFKSFCCFFHLSFSLSLLLSLPPFVPALFLLFLSTSSLSSLHFFPFLHFSSFHLDNFVSLLASFFFACYLSSVFTFGLAVFLHRLSCFLSVRIGAFTAACCSPLHALC